MSLRRADGAANRPHVLGHEVEQVGPDRELSRRLAAGDAAEQSPIRNRRMTLGRQLTSRAPTPRDRKRRWFPPLE